MSIVLLFVSAFALRLAGALPVGGFTIENITKWEEYGTAAKSKLDIDESIWKDVFYGGGQPISEELEGRDPLEEMIRINKNKTDLTFGCIPADDRKIPTRDRLWAGGVIPFRVAPNLNNKQKMKLVKAMLYLTEKTCITFLENSHGKYKDYLYIQAEPNQGCWSHIGRIGGEQKLNLQDGDQDSCWYTGIITHQLMHAIGFHHESSRPDREDYIKMNWENILPQCKRFFDIGGEATRKSSTYRYCSAMHFPAKTPSCALNTSREVIVAKKEPTENNKCMGNGGFPADDDDKMIQEAYDCEKTDPANWVVRYGAKLHPFTPLALYDRKVYGISLDQTRVIEVTTCSRRACPIFSHRGPVEESSQNASSSSSQLYGLCLVRGSGVFVVTSSGSIFQAPLEEDEWNWVEHGKAPGLVSLSHPGCLAGSEMFVLVGRLANGRQAFISAVEDEVSGWQWSNGTEKNPIPLPKIKGSFLEDKICLNITGAGRCYSTTEVFLPGRVVVVTNPAVVPRWKRVDTGYYIFVSGFRKTDRVGCIYALHISFEWKETWKSIRCTGETQLTYHTILVVLHQSREQMKIYTVDPLTGYAEEGTYPGKRYN